MRKTKAKKTWGGKRAGAVVPCSTKIRISATIEAKTHAKLLRIAKKRGLARRNGGYKVPSFMGGAIDALAENLETAEPEYLRIAREARG